MLKPIIDYSKCTTCGACVNACLRGGLEIIDNKLTFVSEDDCTWCGVCEDVCPTGAITCPYTIVAADIADES